MLACLVLLLLAAAPAIPTAIPTVATSSSDETIAGVDGDLISAGAYHTCGLTDPDGTAECWGARWSDYGQTQAPDDVAFTSISAGFWHTCGVRTDGFAECWGYYDYDYDAPPAGVTFASISAGNEYTCGVRTDGTAECWGDDWAGQLSAPDGVTFTTIDAGGFHTCGVRTDGFAECWGYNYSGQSSPPDGTFTSISAGSFHTCGVRTDGAAECWGYNDYGQSSAPAGVAFVTLSAGDLHTCGVRTDGAAECWGRNDYGQTQAPAGVTFTAISAGDWHTCGVRTDGTVECWGLDYYGQSSVPDGFLLVDRTGPTVVSSRSPAPNEAGWHNASVTISYVCTDNRSGVATCPEPVTVDTDGRDQDVAATGSDRAGNTTTVRDLVSIDRAPPAATIAKANVEFGQISGTATDTLSGPRLVTVTLTDTIGLQAGSTVTATLVCDAPDAAAAIACTWTADAPPGVWSAMVTVTDLADNTVTIDGGIIVAT
jgi:hypothetical protein